MEDDEWGPWIENDGLTISVNPGTVIDSYNISYDEIVKRRVWKVITGESFLKENLGKPPTDNPKGKLTYILTYRVKKSKGMRILENILKDISMNNVKYKENIDEK